MKNYWKLFKPMKKYIIMLPFFLIVDVTCELLIPFLLSTIIDEGIEGANINIVITYSIIMASLSIVALFFAIGVMYCSAKITKGFGYQLRQLMWAKIQTFSFANINHFETPSLVTRLMTDVSNMMMAIMFITRIGFRAPVIMIVASIFMFSIDVNLTFIILGFLLGLALVLGFIIFFAVPWFTKLQVEIDGVNLAVQENINGIRVVKSFVREPYEQEKFEKINKGLSNTANHAFSLVMSNMSIISFFVNITIATIILLGGKYIIDGTSFSKGNLNSMISFSVMIMMVLNMLSMMIMNISRASASKKRIDEILNEKVDIPYEQKVKTDEFDQTVIESGDVEFKDVSFSYNKDLNKCAVKNINFKVESGKIVGIIGSTGSGKTSLVQLLSRLYDVTEGEVIISSHNVKDYDLIALRESIGFVNQKNVLFSGTIKDNLRWGNKDATDEEMIEACKIAEAHDFIMSFKDGYDTIVSQGGTSVSGGQKQRLCIARALLKNPKILVLDDSTSAVDTSTEKRIRQSFYSKLKGMTIFIIAQRISSVSDASQIIVLNNGVIDGIGTHDELIQSNEIYKDIYYSQNKKEAEINE